MDAEEPLPGCIDVAAGLVFRNGKLLITQRRHGDHLGGLWEFPGGKREPDESFEACLERELLEELGIEVEIGELLDTVTHAYPEKTVRLKFFRCACRGQEPQPLACAACMWVRRDELDAYAFPEADARLLEKLKENTSWWR